MGMLRLRILLNGNYLVQSRHKLMIKGRINKKMDGLKTLMSLLDANSHVFPEGDYLSMCNALKDVHERVKLRSTEYYEYLDDELNRLQKERDNLHYRTKLTKFMKSEAIRAYAFAQGIHSLREAGVHVNIEKLFGVYLSEFNDHLMIEEVRDNRGGVVRRMADEL